MARPMRNGVANLRRYFEVGRAANDRYLEVLAGATENRDALRVLDRHCWPIKNQGPRHCRLNPVGRALDLFGACLAGEHTINWFKNRDITSRLIA
jgi:hypothetical protein